MTTPEQPAVPVCAATGCTRPAEPVLCQADVRRLGDWIAQLGTEYELLSAAPSMQGREIGTIGGATLAAQRSPARLDVLVLRDHRSKERSETDLDGNNGRGVLEVLHAYAEQVREGRDLAQPVTHVKACLFPCMHRACVLGVGHAVPVPLTVARERKLLADHLGWITGQEFAGDFFDEIRAVWGLLRSANGHASPARRVRRLQAPCGSCGVRAVTHRPGDGQVCCENCGACTAVPEMVERISA